jgi:hypothetical protein
MQPDELANRLAAHQGTTGAFYSYIHAGDRRVEDQNGFVAALVLRALRRLGALTELEPLRQRALDFLESCASPRLPGAFSFYPNAHRPAWSTRLPDDVDDTAIINLELALHARRTLPEIQHVVYEVFMPALVQNISPGAPPWISPLVFPTWLAAPQAGRANPVDCCVNANVLALMAYAGLKELPGYAEACRLIADGLAWAGDSWLRMTSLTPYYPQPGELLYALRNAVSCGADELLAQSRQVADFCAANPAPVHLKFAVCSNAYGGPLWFCPALRLARDAYLSFGQTQNPE